MNVILLIFLNNEFLNIWVTQICAQRKAIFEVWFALFFNIAASYCPTVCFISLKSNSSQFDRRGKSRMVAQAQIPSCGVGNLPWCPSASTSSHWSSGCLPSNPAVLVSDFLSFTFLVKSVTLVWSTCPPPPSWPPSPPVLAEWLPLIRPLQALPYCSQGGTVGQWTMMSIHIQPVRRSVRFYFWPNWHLQVILLGTVKVPAGQPYPPCRKPTQVPKQGFVKSQFSILVASLPLWFTNPCPQLSQTKSISMSLSILGGLRNCSNNQNKQK